MAFAGALMVVAALVAVLDETGGAPDASAQTQPTIAPGSIIQLPPPVPGLADAAEIPGQTPVVNSSLIPGTPVPPVSGGSVTASLEGSDISVSSVGGSYERDAPGKRRNRSPRR